MSTDASPTRVELARLREVVATAPVEVAVLDDPDATGSMPPTVRAVVVLLAAGPPGDAVRAIRRLHRTRPDVRIVAVGDATGEDLTDALGAGAHAWVDQRATPETLAAAIAGRVTATPDRPWWSRWRRAGRGEPAQRSPAARRLL